MNQMFDNTTLAIVGVSSALVHMLVRLLAEVYPKNTTVLLNVMLLANVALLVYFGYALFLDESS